jgi:hypothetical protein
MSPDFKLNLPTGTANRLKSFWSRLTLNRDTLLNLVLGMLGWVYVFYIYWEGEGLGAKLPTYAGF